MTRIERQENMATWVARYSLIKNPQFWLSIIGIMTGVTFYAIWSWHQDVEQSWKKAQDDYQQLSVLIAQRPSDRQVSLSDEALLMTIQGQTLPKELDGKISDLQQLSSSVTANLHQVPASALFQWVTLLAQQGVNVSELQLTKEANGYFSGRIVYGTEAP
jgi:hypothetical protein